MRRRILASLAAIAALGAVLSAAPAAAQETFPSKPIRVIVPYGPGGLTDTVARLLADELRNSLGQNVVVDNRPGATGIIALRDLVRAAPDGHTIFVGNVSTNGLTPILFRDRLELDYDTEVTALARLADVPSLLSVSKEFAPDTFKEFVDYARQNPEKVRYGSAGIGAYQQINFEHLAQQEGLKLTHIPIKGGGGEILQNLIRGDIHVSFSNFVGAQPAVKDGRIKAYAITADERHPSAPDIPTLAELGYGQLGVTQWQVAFAPAKVPTEILERLNAALTKALEAPKVAEVYNNTGMVAPPARNLQETNAWVRDEQQRIGRIVEEAGIKVE